MLTLSRPPPPVNHPSHSHTRTRARVVPPPVPVPELGRVAGRAGARLPQDQESSDSPPPPKGGFAHLFLVWFSRVYDRFVGVVEVLRLASRSASVRVELADPVAWVGGQGGHLWSGQAGIA